MFIVSKKDGGMLIPSIPANRLQGEDGTIPRIRAFETLEGAFSGIEEGGAMLKWATLDGAIFDVLEFNFEDLNLNEDDIIRSEALVLELLVPDALVTGENWILKKFTLPEGAKRKIKLTHWQEKEIDYLPFVDKDSLLKDNEGTVTWIDDLEYEVVSAC